MRLVVPFFILAIATAEVLSGQTIDIHKVSEIKDIEVLDQELDQLVSKVRQCAAAGMAPASDCYCQYPTKLAAARATYKRLENKYPRWMGNSVRWRNDMEALSSNLYLRGIRQQLNQPCS